MSEVAAGVVVDEQEQSQDQSNVLALTSETTIYAVYRKLGADEKAPLGFGVLKEGNALWKKTHAAIKEDGTEDNSSVDTEILRTVTVTAPVVHNIAGITELMGEDEEEAANIFNTGSDAKLIPQLRSRFTQQNEAGDFVYTEETVSVEQSSEIIAQPLKRRALSDTQKAVKVLKGISADALAEALKALGYTA